MLRHDATPAAREARYDTAKAAPSPHGSVRQERAEAPSAIQQSIARIQEACQAPPLAPPEYRVLFEIMAKEINENDLIGAQTLTNITQRAQERGLDVRRDDVRFMLEVVSEADPWFEQGASANLFAGRFRNFVVARCRGQGLNLSADELDLIDAWFAGGTMPASAGAARTPRNARHRSSAPNGSAARARRRAAAGGRSTMAAPTQDGPAADAEAPDPDQRRARSSRASSARGCAADTAGSGGFFGEPLAR